MHLEAVAVDHDAAHRILVQYQFRGSAGSFASSVEFRADRELTVTEPVVRLAHLLGWVEALSYWKAHPWDTIVLPDAARTGPTEALLQALIRDGMAEFAHRNQALEVLDDTQYEFSASSPVPALGGPTPKVSNDDLLLYSGGKDSRATHHALEKAHHAVDLVAYRWSWSDEVEHYRRNSRSGPLQMTRRLDARLRALNREGSAMNGHTPFSAYLAVGGLLLAESLRAEHVFAGNTRSDDEPNVVANGRPINHQWSKSNDFEHLLAAAVRSIGATATYACPLRPFYELQVIDFLLREDVGLESVQTCNQVTDGWCGSCAKCLWLHLAIAALRSPAEAQSITHFRLDPSRHRSQLEAMASLDPQSERPFECTGTVAEVRACIARLEASWGPQIVTELLAPWGTTNTVAELLTARGDPGCWDDHTVDAAIRQLAAES